MRKLTAHYIFPANNPPLKFGILHLDDDGKILDLIDTGGRMAEEASLEFYPGILCPGFVNAHCHLELSHMLNTIPPGGGMTSFIDQIGKKRFEEKEIISKAINSRAAQMYQSGISAVGDIVNTSDSIKEKSRSPVKWHNFVEIFGLRAEAAEEIWAEGSKLEKEFSDAGLDANINPHAPYSISKKLWEKFSNRKLKILSIHNQESRDEENLMREREGDMAQWFKARGLQMDALPEKNVSSLKSYIHFLPPAEKYLFVHNTYTSPDDIRFAEKKLGNEIYWVLCPKANLYIENRLPESIISERKGLNICLGTDSLASNSSLSILEEMKTLQKHFPNISLEELLLWSTINGAKSLGMENALGSFEKGKTPGVIWINNIDFDGFKLREESKSKRLV